MRLKHPIGFEPAVRPKGRMETAVASELMEEICLLICFDTVKNFINSSSDIPNKNMDTLVSLLLSHAGTVSKAKRSQVLQFIEPQLLSAVEAVATNIIGKVQSKFSIDIPEVMNRK